MKWLIIAAILLPIIVGCGDKGQDTGPVPAPGGKRMSLEEAEKNRPKTRGGGRESD